MALPLKARLTTSTTDCDTDDGVYCTTVSESSLIDRVVAFIVHELV